MAFICDYNYLLCSSGGASESIDIIIQSLQSISAINAAIAYAITASNNNINNNFENVYGAIIMTQTIPVHLMNVEPSGC